MLNGIQTQNIDAEGRDPLQDATKLISFAELALNSSEYFKAAGLLLDAFLLQYGAVGFDHDCCQRTLNYIRTTLSYQKMAEQHFLLEAFILQARQRGVQNEETQRSLANLITSLTPPPSSRPVLRMQLPPRNEMN